MLIMPHKLRFINLNNLKIISLLKFKRILISLIVVSALLSGIGQGNSKDASLVLRSNVIHAASSTHAVLLTANAKVKQDISSRQSQVQVLGIGYEKYVSPTPTPTPTVAPWGVAKQVDAHTWSVQVGQDAKEATSQEIFVALNAYRQKNGRRILSWSDSLAQYAQSRAVFFIGRGSLDAHSGFLDFVNNQDGFKKLGFASLGENSSIGYVLEAVHLIEWVYAADQPHNDNQLSNDWLYVGIGVNGSATDLVFGGKKL